MASPTVGKDSVAGAVVKAGVGTAVQADGHWVEYDQFVDQQIRKTRGQVKGTELAVALMTLVAGTLGYFLLAALADHWLFAHGFGFWGRLLALLVYLGGAGYFAYRRVLRPRPRVCHYLPHPERSYEPAPRRPPWRPRRRR